MVELFYCTSTLKIGLKMTFFFFINFWLLINSIKTAFAQFNSESTDFLKFRFGSRIKKRICFKKLREKSVKIDAPYLVVGLMVQKKLNFAALDLT